MSGKPENVQARQPNSLSQWERARDRVSKPQACLFSERYESVIRTRFGFEKAVVPRGQGIHYHYEVLMFSTVITAAVLYIATAVDLLVILLIFFARANTRKEYRDIYIGQYLGSVILILVSLFLAFVLHYVPEKWVLGLLGLIPIYLGIKVAIYDDCEGEKRAKKELDEKGLSKLVGIVALVTVASCGADNIGLFVPYFVTLDLVDLLVTLLVF